MPREYEERSAIVTCTSSSNTLVRYFLSNSSSNLIVTLIDLEDSRDDTNLILSGVYSYTIVDFIKSLNKEIFTKIVTISNSTISTLL